MTETAPSHPVDYPDSQAADALETAITGIEYPNASAAQAAHSRQDDLALAANSLGLLENLASWAASVQGHCPPTAFADTRLVLFAGDHGIASEGVSVYPIEVTAQQLANITAGGAALNALAVAAGVSIRLVDMSVETDTEPAISAFKIGRSTGRIDQTDALSRQQCRQALEAGITIANQEIDAGAELLIAADLGVANSTPATTVISILTDTEPIKVVGRSGEIDDATWIRKCAAIRDARRRGWPHRADITDLLTVVGGADLAALTGFLLQAANRRTPVLLDSMVVSAAALLAQSANPRVVRWFQAAHLTPHPAHDIALRQLGLSPIVNLGISLGQGTGALIALPILRAGTLILSQTITFDAAGVSRSKSNSPLANM